MKNAPKGSILQILSTFIKLPFVIKIFVLSSVEQLRKTGFTVSHFQLKCASYTSERMLDSHTSTFGLSGSPFLTLAIEERRHIGVGFHTSLLGTTPHTVANGTVLAAIVLETWCFTFRALPYWSDISCNMINTLRVRNE